MTKLNKVLALVLSFMMIVSAVPMAFASNSVTIAVTADKDEVSIGDTVNFTFTLQGADSMDAGIDGYLFDVVLGDGLEYDSYSIPAEASEAFTGIDFYEDNMRTGCISSNASSYTGSSIALLVITCVVVDENDLTATVAGADLTDGNDHSLVPAIESATLTLHTCDFAAVDYDENGHWWVCECGETTEVEDHECVENGRVEGNCQEEGSIEWICECGYGYTEFTGFGDCIDENGDLICDICGNELCEHDWAEATCTEPETCNICGKTKGTALGHDWEDATCTEAKTCKRCGEPEGEALGHDPVTDYGYDATCTEDGLSDGVKCDRCGKVITEQEIISAYGHNWQVKDASEHEIIWECANCHETMIETLDTNTVVRVNPDGSVVITTYNEDGTITVEVRNDGVTVIMLTDGKETVLDMDVIISGRAADAANKSGKPVELPMDQYVLYADGSVDIDFTVHSYKSVPVELPVVNVNPGCVIVIVNADGTETVVANTKMTENGLVFNCADGMTVKIVNKAMSFSDVKANIWYGDAVAFVTARGIMNGVGNNSFAPTATTTRAQVWAMLARLSGVDAYGADWATIAREWAMAKGITDGERADDSITRQELVTMLYRFVGEKGDAKSVSSFSDAGKISSWAKAAMEWAYAEGVMNGNADGTLNPTGNTTRAEMAQFFMNFIQNV